MIAAKITKVLRNLPSGIRVQFSTSAFNISDQITNDRRYGTVYYISNKQEGVYDLMPRYLAGSIPDLSALKEGVEFVLVSVAIGEFDSLDGKERKDIDDEVFNSLLDNRE